MVMYHTDWLVHPPNSHVVIYESFALNLCCNSSIQHVLLTHHSNSITITSKYTNTTYSTKTITVINIHTLLVSLSVVQITTCYKRRDGRPNVLTNGRDVYNTVHTGMYIHAHTHTHTRLNKTTELLTIFSLKPK